MYNYSVYEGITQKELDKVKICLKFIERTYNKNEIISQNSGSGQEVGIVKSGIVYLGSESINGQNSMIDYFEKGEAFSARFFRGTELNSYYMIAKTKCVIEFVNYQNLVSCCKNCCEGHLKLFDNILTSATLKSQSRVDILSQHNIRSKLLSYFYYLKDKKNTDVLNIPLSMVELSSFLAVNRSAMTREIKNMNEEGIINSSGKKVALLE